MRPAPAPRLRIRSGASGTACPPSAVRDRAGIPTGCRRAACRSRRGTRSSRICWRRCSCPACCPSGGSGRLPAARRASFRSLRRTSGCPTRSAVRPSRSLSCSGSRVLRHSAVPGVWRTLCRGSGRRRWSRRPRRPVSAPSNRSSRRLRPARARSSGARRRSRGRRFFRCCRSGSPPVCRSGRSWFGGGGRLEFEDRFFVVRDDAGHFFRRRAVVCEADVYVEQRRPDAPHRAGPGTRAGPLPRGSCLCR